MISNNYQYISAQERLIGGQVYPIRLFSMETPRATLALESQQQTPW